MVAEGELSVIVSSQIDRVVVGAGARHVFMNSLAILFENVHGDICLMLAVGADYFWGGAVGRAGPHRLFVDSGRTRGWFDNLR